MTTTPSAALCNLLQAVNTGDNQDLHFGYSVSLAQTFTLTATWTALCMAACLNTYLGAEAKMWCHVHSTDGAGKPTGSPWAIGYFHKYPFQRLGHTYWTTYVFDPPPVLPAGQYAIELIGGFVPEFLMWRWRLNDSPTPPPTEKCWRSLDFGTSWAQLPAWVFMHELWGWEPPPDPPFPPEPIYWAPTDEVNTPRMDGFQVVVETESKCHLYMRWTLEPPLKHKISRVVRGITLSTETRFCFVAFHENEQEEPGDTLVHTFIKDTWPVCETRYYYFIGSKQRQESPSASALFTKHRRQQDVPILYGPADAQPENRTVRGNHALWPNTHDAAAGTIPPLHGAPWFRILVAARLTATYWIERGFIRFDTSSIPPDSTLVQARLDLWVQSKLLTSSIGDPYIYLTQGIQSTPIVGTDYGDQLPHTTVGGQVSIADLIVGAYNEIWLNADGLSWLLPGGTTRFCIRQQMDVEDTPPPLGANQFAFNSQQGPADRRPLLTIWYVPP